MAKVFTHTFEDIISLDNLLLAWQEFRRGKRQKADVQRFEFSLMDNLIALHHDLANGNYRHGGYKSFNICDPKPRNIHKASVRDRLVHHAVYRQLYPYFDRKFIADSHSCRLNKGTHKALNRFRKFAYQVSQNNSRTCWILKGDIKKFFASVGHWILKDILARQINDQKILNLLEEIIDSFISFPLLSKEGRGEVMKSSVLLESSKPPLTPPWKGGELGLPLGNLTSQLLVNIYLNEFDQFIKQQLKIKHYLRYCDDFVVFSENRGYLENIIKLIAGFLLNKLKLTLHPDKIFIKTLNSGLDSLGWVHFFDHRVLRAKAKRRMFKRIKNNPKAETVNSYLGLLKHGNSYKIRQRITNCLSDITQRINRRAANAHLKM
ncbi:MAG: reverse transcriptase/maturase family protein [Patescibacteria group bacterium]